MGKKPVTNPQTGCGGSVYVWGVGTAAWGATAASVLLLFGLLQGSIFPRTANGRLLQDARGGFAAGAAMGRQLQAEALDDPHFLTESGGLAIKEYCLPADSHALAARFRNLTLEVPLWTACGETKWIEELHKLSPSGDRTFFDIGCNKGFTSAKFFGLWAPEVGFNPKAIHEKRPDVWCGNCGDCQEEVKSQVAASDGQVQVFCIEPSQTNFAQLILTRDLFFKNNKPTTQWFTMNLAMANSTGIAHFSRECTSEQCALDVTSQHNYDLIYTSTVDAFLRKHEIDFVDVLKIDTEGFDATVIQGAMESIARGSIGVISFEYHEVGVWKEYKLKHVVEWLNGFNYVCYFDGKPSYSRLTGCWDDLYEYYNWSNVVCVPRAHPLYAVMERGSLRYQMYERTYYQEAGGAGAGAAASGSSAAAQAQLQ